MPDRILNLSNLMNTSTKIDKSKFDGNVEIDKMDDVDSSSKIDNDALKWNGNGWVAGIPTSTVSSYADYASPTDLTNKINDFKNSAPTTLDTLEEIADALNDNPTVISDLVAFINRSSVLTFNGDGVTQVFPVTHLAGNLDVWVNGIHQVPNITDSEDLYGTYTSSVLNTTPKSYDYDYHSSTNLDEGYGIGNLLEDYSSYTNKPYMVFEPLPVTDNELRVWGNGSDFLNVHPYGQNATIKTPVYEIIGEFDLTSGQYDAYPDQGNNFYSLSSQYSSSAFYWFETLEISSIPKIRVPNRIEGHIINSSAPQDPDGYKGYIGVDVNLVGNFSQHRQYYYSKIWQRVERKNAITTPKTNATHLFFNIPPVNGAKIKVKVY